MSEIQSVLFNKKDFTQKQALARLKKYNMIPIKKVDITKTKYRYRQKNPNKYKIFRIKKIKKGIEFVIGFKK
jgi:hypothetical protein